MNIQWTEKDADNLWSSMGHLKWVLRDSRDWHAREQISSGGNLHPAIRKAIGFCPPDNWHLLVLEWAHNADSDPSRVAYTQNDRKGESDIQTVTSVGKYLHRHFSLMPDHTVRDIAAMYAGHSYEILRTMPAMLDALSRAPKSCMNNGTWEDEDWDEHPYNVYDPQYGWALAISKCGDKITGRCLVNESDDRKIFVRSYSNGETFSYSNAGMEMWLREHGYTKANSWEGCKFKRIQRDGYSGAEFILAPYLDGDSKEITVHDTHCMIVECDAGEFTCDNTDGRCTENHTAYCDSCEEGVDEDDLFYVESNDVRVCSGCLEHSYVYAIGIAGREYYVSRDDASWVESQDNYYHDRYLDENDIIYLDDVQEYDHRENAHYLDSRGEYVHIDNECAIFCEHSDTYEHIDDCVQLHDGEYALTDDAHLCEHSGDWYLDEVSFAETPCGKSVHPDYFDLYNKTLQAA